MSFILSYTNLVLIALLGTGLLLVFSSLFATLLQQAKAEQDNNVKNNRIDTKIHQNIVQKNRCKDHSRCDNFLDLLNIICETGATCIIGPMSPSKISTPH
jgi:hypothetical protein